MPKKHLSITHQAATMLLQFVEKNKKTGNRTTESEVVSKAIVQYVLAEGRDYAEKKMDDAIERLLLKQFNRLAAMIASVGVDVDMVLADTLEQRLAEHPNVPPKKVMEDLRKSGVELFKDKESFKILMSGE